jgi:hypothetical protein
LTVYCQGLPGDSGFHNYKMGDVALIALYDGVQEHLAGSSGVKDGGDMRRNRSPMGLFSRDAHFHTWERVAQIRRAMSIMRAMHLVC